MSTEFIGRPSDPEDVRRDFEELLAELEQTPSRRVSVMFGFAWASKIYERDWLELSLTASELRDRVVAAEAAGHGKIGSDDLFVRFPEIGVELHYCHESDIHVIADDPMHAYLAAVRQKWLDLGWEVNSCSTRD